MNSVDRVVEKLTAKLEITKNAAIEIDKAVKNYKDNLFTLAKLRALQKISKDITDRDIIDADQRLVKIKFNLRDALFELLEILGSICIGGAISFYLSNKSSISIPLLISGSFFLIVSFFYKAFTK
jgi:hypothetical protein